MITSQSQARASNTSDFPVKASDRMMLTVMDPKLIGEGEKSHVHKSWWQQQQQHHLLLLPINVGVTDTMPMRKSVARDWKSYRSPTDCNSPRAIPAYTKHYIRIEALQIHLFIKCKSLLLWITSKYYCYSQVVSCFLSSFFGLMRVTCNHYQYAWLHAYMMESVIYFCQSFSLRCP